MTEASPGSFPDLFAGLARRPLRIPSKYFYDDRGSALFDAICDLPEYYPTRTEQALLDRVAGEIAALAPTAHLLELGSGTARKTRSLIGALLEVGDRLRYTPVDISEYALKEAARSLTREFPGLKVQGIRCDYTETLDGVDPAPGALAAFLGSTIGNFEPEKAAAVLGRLRRHLNPGDRFLLGVDLVKETSVLEAAYNDSEGLTAEFNKNILTVVNREVGGDFDPADFFHKAVFNPEASQIEMYLVARRPVLARLEALDLDVKVEPGESIRTEISRKFRRDSASALLVQGGFSLDHWFESDDGYFALALATAEGESPGP